MNPIDPYDTTRGYYYPGYSTYYPSYSTYNGVHDGIVYPRYPRRDYHVMPAPVSTLLSLSGPEKKETSSRFDTPPSQQQPQQQIMYPVPCPTPLPFLPAPFQENQNPSEREQMLRHNAQFAPPGMYPAGPTPYPYHNPHPPYQSVPPLPPGARALGPPRMITSDDLRYKCSVCGRFRSPKFHHENPITPGELPRKTVCTRCRRAGSDSEEYYGSDGRRRRYDRYRSRGRSRISDEVEVVVNDDRLRRSRRPSRMRLLSRSPSRRRIATRSYYSSDSTDSEEVEIIETSRRRRPRSPSVEVVERTRYVDEVPRRPAVRETVVEERVPVRRRSSYDEAYYEDHYYDRPRRRRMVSRAPTPMPRVVHRQYTDPLVRGPSRVARREYYDGPTSVVEEMTEVIRQPRPLSRPPSRSATVISTVGPSSSVSRRASESEDSDYRAAVSHRQRYRSRSRGRSWSLSRGHGRLRSSRHSDDDDLLDAPLHSYIRAPSPPPPPPFRSSSLSYIEPRTRRGEIESTPITQHEAFDRHGRPTTVTRRQRSKSRDVAELRQRLPFLRPGDEVIEIQRHPAPTEDYDWYDRDGMRVRVREI